MRYFVTGASGFLGGVLVRQLREAGHDVVGFVRRPDAARHLTALGVELRVGDITDPKSVRDAMRGADGLFHAAAWYKVGQSALTPGPGATRGGGGERAEARRINVDGTRNVLEAMRDLGIPKGVYTSTIGVFGDTKGRTVDESHLPGRPDTTHYSRTKWEAHYEVAVPMIREGLPLVILQPGVVYGAGDHSPVRGVMNAYLQRRLPFVFGRSAYSWGHVEDTADAHRSAMEKGRSGDSYLITGPSHSLAEALRIAESITGIPAPRVLPDVILDIAAVLVRTESVRVAGATYLGSNAKARRELGFAPRPLAEGFAEVLPAHLAELRAARA